MTRVSQHPVEARAFFAQGLESHQKGRLAEAENLYLHAIQMAPDYAEAFCNRGAALHGLGKLEEAVESYHRAVALKPDYADAYNNLGITLQRLGRLDQALASYRHALSLNPNSAQAHFNAGAALQELGNLEESILSYRAGLVLQPNNADIYLNVGIALQGLDRSEEAVDSYRHFIALKPGHAGAHSNLGGLLLGLGRLEEAAAAFGDALEIAPDDAEVRDNLGRALQGMGWFDEALAHFSMSLQNRDSKITKALWLECLPRASLADCDRSIHAAMARALTEPWTRPGTLASAAAALVQSDPDVKESVARAVASWPRRLPAETLFEKSGPAVLGNNALLIAIFDNAPICSRNLEKFLTMARRCLLDAAMLTGSPEHKDALSLTFYAALAGQCFINEYIFACEDDELCRANELRSALIEDMRAAKPVTELQLAAVAAYFPLHSLPGAQLLTSRPWSAKIAALIKQQVEEPAEELGYRSTIPRLTPIEGEVSQLVSGQYLVNPYPRWIKANPKGEPANIDDHLRNLYPGAKLRPFGAKHDLNILIAGCGTGQHPIERAQYLPSARILAVDLSPASLGYAKRKTVELGITNIEYGHADLFKLGVLDRKFDVIESVGVLHHTAKPWKGWRLLLSLLQPDGVMVLGFYSARARRNISEVRSLISGRRCGGSPAEIRSFRQSLMDDPAFEWIFSNEDAFSMSGCRDLLFHVQEHHLTLGDISSFIRENALEFLGFSHYPEVLKAYRQRFPQDPAAMNLDFWDVFESENPGIFAGMYQFAVQKRK